MTTPMDDVWYARSCIEAVPATPPLAGRHEAEVAIVGGGLAGLAAALSLAERGVAATLLEAGELAGAASGRNGGMVMAGFANDGGWIAQRLGLADARALHGHSAAAARLIRTRVDGYAIAAGPVDGVVTASVFRDPAGLRRDVAWSNAELGTRLEVQGRPWMARRYATARYGEGVFDPDGFHLDPLALARGYARAAQALGARLHTQSPVASLAPEGAGWRVGTAAGSVAVRHVILATNVGKVAAPAGQPTPVPAQAQAQHLARAILPVATMVLVTQPLGAAIGRVVAPPFAVYDDRFATGYYRPLADGRLLWGGRVALHLARGTDIGRLMRRDLASIYPQLADVPIEAAWSGWMGFARHKMPLVGRLAPGLWSSTGYGGHGLNTTTMGGELLARAITAADPALDLLAPFAPQPLFGPLGRVAAMGIYHGGSARDALRERLGRARQKLRPAAAGA